MRHVYWLALLSAGLAAQTPGQADLTRLTQELRSAIQQDLLATASELAIKLDDAVQKQHSAWLTRDAGERVKEVRSWLPADTESLWVNQEPFTIKAEVSVDMLYRQPALEYSLGELFRLNEGSFYRALAGYTVRITVNGARIIPARSTENTGYQSIADGAYFYFFTDAIKLPPPDGFIQGQPLWHATVKGTENLPLESRAMPKTIDEDRWIAQARPDLLVLVKRRELLTEILQRMAAGSKTQALPDNLPEWRHVDSSAPFWGLRHYTAQSKPKRGEQGFNTAELPLPDGGAVGVTVRFDAVEPRLEIDYLSTAQLSKEARSAGLLRDGFQVDHSTAGVWRLVSDKQGSTPFDFALELLGYF